MLEFETIETLEPNLDLLKLINNFDYIFKKGVIRVLKNTNLKFIKPTEYIIKSSINLTILEYKVNEVSNKTFYIKEYHQKYNLKEIIQIVKNIK